MSETISKLAPTPRTVQTIDLTQKRLKQSGEVRPDPGKSRLYYFLCRIAIRCLFKIYFRGSLDGKKNVPSTGPALILCNHMSFVDPPFIGSIIEREMHFLARESLFDFRPFGAALTSINVHKIRREGIDRDAMKLCSSILRAGWPLLLFPEGTRSADGKIGEVRGGFGMILEHAPGVPILPAILSGSNKALGRGKFFPRPARVTLKMGKPILIPPRPASQSRRDYYKHCAEQLKKAWEDLGGDFRE